MIGCIGGAHLDRHGVLRGPLVLGTSNPGAVHVSEGGVARNVAENLARLGERVTLVSRVGDDASGAQVLRHAATLGIDVACVSVSQERPTASYTAILENTGELVIGLADMDVYDEITPEVLEPALPRLREHSRWFLDTNLPAGTIEWLLTAAGKIPVAVDAISVAKSVRLRPLLPRIALLFTNQAQVEAIAGPGSQAKDLQRFGVHAGIVTAGAKGITVYEGDSARQMAALPAVPRDVTGAGDALVAGTLHGLQQGASLFDAARLGLAAAAITVESPFTTDPQLTTAMLRARA